MGISVAFFAVVVIAASFLAYVGGQRILSSIWALTAAARQIGQRNFDLRVVIESGDEFEELARAFNEMVPELSERARIGETLQVAREVQQHLLPGAAPQIPGLDVAGQTEFCDETGGDYYDFLDLEAVEPGLIAVAVGDVAGHGIPSALLMTTVRALLHGFARERHTPASLLNAVNPLLVKDVHHGRFMSLFYLLADGGQRQFQWVSAGHGPAFRYNRHSRIWDELEGTDIPLGVEKDWRFGPTLHTDWRAGDVLLLATDGIWETRGEMQRRFGMTRLRAVVEDCAAGSAASICAHVMEALKDFRGKVAPSDDMTLVVVKVLEEGDEVAV
jgi:sigma-B regulation protein RsbU (phosphoserine phosphatase)